MVLVTGATGLVGHAVVCRLLIDDNHPDVAVAIRTASGYWPPQVRPYVTGDMEAPIDWSIVLKGTTTVVHCAARVHVMADTARDPLEEFRRINVQGTLNLAQQAAVAGVRRFIFISSIKVNGEKTERNHSFMADDTPAPLDAYGISKMEAEYGLWALAGQTGMEIVIIRPPLVYGPGAKANFARMMSWLRRGVPLPLGAVHNRRSFVALDNLVDLVAVCTTHPNAANQVFLVSDDEDVSTAELLRRMGRAMGRPVRLLPIPVGCLKAMAFLTGKQDITTRLCDSLQVDIEKTRCLLNWSPPFTMDQGLRKIARNISI